MKSGALALRAGCQLRREDNGGPGGLSHVVDVTIHVPEEIPADQQTHAVAFRVLRFPEHLREQLLWDAAAVVLDPEATVRAM